MRSRQLRTGYTTGACAAAAAKAATAALLGTEIAENQVIEIPFPDGTRHGLPIAWLSYAGFPVGVFAAVVKDGGDDPDVTHGAEILAKVVFINREHETWGSKQTGRSAPPGSSVPSDADLPVIEIGGGKGVGRVTQPGLAVPMGEAAINPGPQSMIRSAIAEAIVARPSTSRELPERVEVTIWVPEGEVIARRTLNRRLGIIGGISILGTTGIVRPLSTEAWTATIAASMDVARATGLREIVLSSGRSSEKAHMAQYGLAEAGYVMMGDYVEFALLEARRHGFERVHLVAQWAKMLKAALGVPQTHVRHGAIDLRKAVLLLRSLGCPDLPHREFNTAREIFDAVLLACGPACHSVLSRVCSSARTFAESVTGGIPVTAHLVSFSGEVIARDG